MASASELIAKLNTCTSCFDFFKINGWSQQFEEAHAILDDCHSNDCVQAIEKLNFLHQQMRECKQHTDDAGLVMYSGNGKSLQIFGDKVLLKRSLDNYNKLMKLTGERADNFKRYLPKSMIQKDDFTLHLTFKFRCLPLRVLSPLDQKHVNWITNRMLEFSMWLEENGVCHGGINPESVYVIPENHGVCFVSLYHMTAANAKPVSISGQYANFYPSSVFVKKLIDNKTDVELIKRTALYLLGDQTGRGHDLLKTAAVDDFVLHYMNVQDTRYMAATLDMEKATITANRLLPSEELRAIRNIQKKHYDVKQFHALEI